MSRNDIMSSTHKPVSHELSFSDDETCKTLQLAQDLIRALDVESEAHMSHISAADKQCRTEQAGK
jgi:hypothetical protein